MLIYTEDRSSHLDRGSEPMRELRSGLSGLGGRPTLHPAWCAPSSAQALRHRPPMVTLWLSPPSYQAPAYGS